MEFTTTLNPVAGGEKMVLVRQLSTTSTAPPEDCIETPSGDRCLVRMLASTSTAVDERVADDDSENGAGEAMDEPPRLCLGLSPLQSELGKWAQWAVRWEDTHALRIGDSGDDDEDSDAGGSMSSAAVSGAAVHGGSEAADDDGEATPRQSDEVPRLCVGSPALKSDLGRWARWAVRFAEQHGEAASSEVEAEASDEEWPHVMLREKEGEEEEEEPPRMRAGMPVLQSELGKWAYWAVRWEEMCAARCEDLRLVDSGDDDDSESMCSVSASEGATYGGSELFADDGGEVAESAEWPLILAKQLDEAPRLCLGTPALQSDLAQWARWAVRFEEEHGGVCFEEDGLSEVEDEVEADWPPVMPEAQEEQPRLCAGLPLLQSELGKWAHWAVRWEEMCAVRCEELRLFNSGDGEDSDVDASMSSSDGATHGGSDWADDDDDEGEVMESAGWPSKLPKQFDEAPRLCLGTPALESDLARWAQWAVRFEEAHGDDASFGDSDEDCS